MAISLPESMQLWVEAPKSQHGEGKTADEYVVDLVRAAQAREGDPEAWLRESIADLYGEDAGDPGSHGEGPARPGGQADRGAGKRRSDRGQRGVLARASAHLAGTPRGAKESGKHVSPPRIVIRPAAARDVDDKAEELAQTSERTAARFLEAVDRTIQDLARMPGMGAPYPVSNPQFQGLRAHSVRGKFRKQIIFYLPTDDGIEVSSASCTASTTCREDSGGGSVRRTPAAGDRQETRTEDRVVNGSVLLPAQKARHSIREGQSLACRPSGVPDLHRPGRATADDKRTIGAEAARSWSRLRSSSVPAWDAQRVARSGPTDRHSVHAIRVSLEGELLLSSRRVPHFHRTVGAGAENARTVATDRHAGHSSPALVPQEDITASLSPRSTPSPLCRRR